MTTAKRASIRSLIIPLLRIGVILFWFNAEALVTLSGRLVSSRERNSVGDIADHYHRIIGWLNPVGELPRQEQKCPFGRCTVRDRALERDRPELDESPLPRPGLRGIIRLVARLGKLRLKVERCRSARKPFRDIAHEEVRVSG